MKSDKEPSSKSKTKFEVADVFRHYGEGFRQQNRLSNAQLKVMRHIETCRSATLGGHVEQCNLCGFERISYNSCRDRHCPKCQTLVKEKWLDDRKSELLPCGYFHLHCLVPGGALSFEKDRWIPAKHSFLFRVKSLAKEFKKQYLSLLKTIYAKGELIFPGKTAQYESRENFYLLIQSAFKTKWIAYAKRPFAGPVQVLEYLGRYTHRIVISNHRIKSIDNGKVVFSYRDRADNNELKEMSLTAEEFIRRFLLHVLPEKFMKIRYFGFLSNINKKQAIHLIRRLMGSNAALPEKQNETVI